jgi:hypothetical protein
MVTDAEVSVPVLRVGQNHLFAVTHPLADIDAALAPDRTIDTDHGPGRPVDAFNLDRRPGRGLPPPAESPTCRRHGVTALPARGECLTNTSACLPERSESHDPWELTSGRGARDRRRVVVSPRRCGRSRQPLSPRPHDGSAFQQRRSERRSLRERSFYVKLGLVTGGLQWMVVGVRRRFGRRVLRLGGSVGSAVFGGVGSRSRHRVPASCRLRQRTASLWVLPSASFFWR